MRVASIDVGSNSVLMLVAELQDDGHWKRLEDHAAVARIAEGLDHYGRLSEEPVARAQSVLSRFVDHARALHVDAILLTGTAPFRRATNGEAIARQLGDRLGVPMHVVSGDEEAALTLRATIQSFPEQRAHYIVDIGGASTEVLRCVGDAVEVVSFDIGVVRLHERFVRHDPPTDEEQDAVRRFIRRVFHDHWPVPPGALPLIGVAGTVTALAALDLEMTGWDPDRVQGHVVSKGNIRAWAERLWPMNVEARCVLAGMDPKRADVIAVGAWLLYELCAYLEVDAVTVSDRGLRWGRLFRDGKAEAGRGKQ